MTWHAAHMVVSARSDQRSTVDVHEFVYLIQADDLEMVEDQVNAIGRSLEQRLALAHERQRGAGERLTFKYEGVRTFVSILNPWPRDQDQEPPVSGTELTYRFYDLPPADMKHFMRDKKVNIDRIE